MNRKVTCALCKRDYPASKCEQSVRGYECNNCIERRLRVALRKMGGVTVKSDGSVYGIGGGDEQANAT